jgi:hypothetical protein
MGVLPFCRKFLLPYYLKRSGLESGKSCGFRSAARGCGARTGGSGCESMAFVREKSLRSRYHARLKDPGKDSGIPEDKSVGIHFNIRFKIAVFVMELPSSRCLFEQQIPLFHFFHAKSGTERKTISKSLASFRCHGKRLIGSELVNGVQDRSRSAAPLNG